MIGAAIGLATAPARIMLAGARWLAELNLAVVDADVARWYVDDGQLSEEPLTGSPNPELRAARQRAVDLLEFVGGHDPHPVFLAPPTEAQRAYVEARRR